METVLLCVILLYFILSIRFESVLTRREREKVLAKFGDKLPMTDEEFVAACSAGVNPETALKVRETIVDVYGIDAEMIHPDMDLVELESL